MHGVTQQRNQTLYQLLLNTSAAEGIIFTGFTQKVIIQGQPHSKQGEK